MKRLLMLNIILLTLSLSACGGSDKDNLGTDSAISQGQVSVSQNIEDENSEDSSDESENGEAKDEEDTTADNNGNAASNPASGADEDTLTDTDADTDPNGFEVITTVSADRENGGYTRYFSDVESFLEAYGFDTGSDIPILEYSIPDGEPYGGCNLYLYYNPETHIGCGYRIRQENPNKPGYAFVFDSFEEENWDRDYYALVSVENGSDGSDRVDDYRTNIVYDDNGNLLEFESSGFADWYDKGITVTVLHFTYEYNDNGTLQYRRYSHSPEVFGSYLCTLRTYFDDLGRPVYERGYITHGHLEYYYIYTDNKMTPTYCLCIDVGGNFPILTIYTQ